MIKQKALPYALPACLQYDSHVPLASGVELTLQALLSNCGKARQDFMESFPNVRKHVLSVAGCSNSDMELRRKSVVFDIVSMLMR